MALPILTWVLSFGFHAAFALVILMPARGTALQEGTGDDIMVVEQGLFIEGFAKLGEDLVSVEAVEAPPVEMAAAQPLPIVVKPVEEQQVITAEGGPEQESVKEPEEVEEQEAEEMEQLLPQQVATVQQDSVVAQRESSGVERTGGDATAHSAYLGALRSHLERSKVNPQTSFVGTSVIRFRVNSTGELVLREIVKSSGQKVLDDSAMSSVEKASPFPPIPEGLGRDYVEISVPFNFSVR